jgi:hypothetical protein
VRFAWRLNNAKEAEQATIMGNEQKKTRSAVRRDYAESYLLTSLVAFAVTVIATRVCLELADYPQLGNSVLHIAHALWGGTAAVCRRSVASRIGQPLGSSGQCVVGRDGYWAFHRRGGQVHHPGQRLLLSAGSYGFFLLTVFVYLYFRRPRHPDSRRALYHAFEGLQDALEGDLDTAEASRIDAQLAIAQNSDRDEIVSLAKAISGFLQAEKQIWLSCLFCLPTAVGI